MNNNMLPTDKHKHTVSGYYAGVVCKNTAIIRMKINVASGISWFRGKNSQADIRYPLIGVFQNKIWGQNSSSCKSHMNFYLSI